MGWCNEGFTGQRCENKIQTKSNKQDFWMIFQLTLTITLLILLPVMLCFQGRILSKMSIK
ncbi:unnamed protein product [Larinioides sclopetarius]|uniref:EGF-like domain-containing protein n=1 Tax=Larinioides sclopetarius TaxID=280406 RepID=A0AAV2BXN8_9ARAC